jgi:hypothetical protein
MCVCPIARLAIVARQVPLGTTEVGCRGGARVGGSVSLVNVTLLSIIMWRCLMPRARLERMVPSRRGHVWCTHGRPSTALDYHIRCFLRILRTSRQLHLLNYYEKPAKSTESQLGASLDVGMDGCCPPLLDCGIAHGARCATLKTRPRSDHAFALSECTEVTGITGIFGAQPEASGSIHGATPSTGREARQAART